MKDESAVETQASVPAPKQSSPSPAAQKQTSSPTPGPVLPSDSTTTMGPSLPPVDDAGAAYYPDDLDVDQDTNTLAQQDDTSGQPPASPYTASRTLIHNLTLPTVPSLDIPPSPPLSPSHATERAALTAKFDKFLELKRKKGTHFNAKIADSHALKNPPLMDKLLDFAGVSTSFEDADGTEQYATVLDKELWDPSSFPEWAYRGPLRKAQERQQKEKGRERGQAVHFVPAS